MAVRCETISRRFGRGLRTSVERGLWPGKANVLGYASGEVKQILGQEGEPPAEIEGIERRADRRGEADRFEFVRANPSCHGPGFEDWKMRTAPRCKRRRGPEIVLDAEKASVGRDRITGRISKIGDGPSRTALYESAHIILTKPLKGCSQITTEEMADSDRQTHRRLQGQLWARLPIGGDHASNAY